MPDIENDTFSNTTSINCEVCSFTYSWTIFVLVVVAINCILTVPSGSWALWLLRSGSQATLEAEFFLLHLFCMDIACVFLNIYAFCNYFIFCKQNLQLIGIFLYQLSLHSLPLFQCLVCVERYVAVVHPLTFLKYKPLRYKASCLCLAWLVAVIFELFHFFLHNPITLVVVLIPIVCTKSYCSLSILWVLKRPSLGNTTGTRERKGEGNLMKQKAFIIIILLLLKLLVNYMPIIVIASMKPTISFMTYKCTMYSVVVNICFFGSFIQPFLYLQRAGKLWFI